MGTGEEIVYSVWGIFHVYTAKTIDLVGFSSWMGPRERDRWFFRGCE